MPRRTKLDGALIDAIVSKIRVGVYPYIAAQAAGVPKSTFYEWMEKGGRKGTRGIYRDLLERVLRASGTARAHAEVRVFKDAPISWLKSGPGREDWSDGPIQIQADVRQEVQHTVSPEVCVQGLLILEQLGICEIKGLPSPDERTLDVEAEEPGGDGDGQTMDVESGKPGDGKVPQDDGRV